MRHDQIVIEVWADGALRLTNKHDGERVSLTAKQIVALKALFNEKPQEATTLTIFETLEQQARAGQPQMHKITQMDCLEIEFHSDWVEGTQFVYKHNGVRIERERARELVPGYPV